MTDQEIIAQNTAWLNYIKPRLRKIAWDYRATSQTPGMKFKFRYGPGESQALNLPVQPSALVVAWWNEITAYHRTTFPTHNLSLWGSTEYQVESGKTIYVPPTGVVYAAPEPGPYDLPKPDELPIQCIPCIVPPQTARQLMVI